VQGESGVNLITLATSRLGSLIIIWICRILPHTLAYRLAWRLSLHLAQQDELPFVKALRRNMAVVGDLTESHPELERAVLHLLYNTLCSYVDFFRASASGREAIYAACRFDGSAYQLREACAASNQGLLIVGVHMCSFDLLLLGLKKLFPSLQVLSNASPTGSSCVMNDIRRQHGLDITPISTQSLRQAIHTLRSGGVVAVAADLPSEDGEELQFFGRKSRLVTGHARLAAKTNARMVVGASRRVGPGNYQALAKPVPQPDPTGDRKQDVIRWAQGSLRVIEDVIRNSPEEWLMPLPVWPDLAPQTGVA
jgi:lauroyl/myristoyl acyltransferase